jgi:hypothetical protein
VFVDVLYVRYAGFVNVLGNNCIWVPIHVLHLLHEDLALLHQPRHNVKVHRFLFELITDERQVF